ncbi:MAG TPA: maleylacetoacetate isomerase, partial [Burkholderiaceae bacterium]
WRVRIALALKGLPYETVPVHLLRDGGQQLTAEYRRLNPDALVPALVDDAAASTAVLTQSLAIIEYLEETHPAPPLLPPAALDRAHVRGLALSVACEIHPLNNLRVLRYLVRQLKVSDEDKDAWYRHWCEQGLATIETTLAKDPRTGTFCCGESPGLADCFLIPQVANAQRLNCDLSAMPTVMLINQSCMALPAFGDSAPARQPDAE